MDANVTMPPLPDGFVLDGQGSSTPPPLPDGFVLDGAPAQRTIPQQIGRAVARTGRNLASSNIITSLGDLASMVPDAALSAVGSDFRFGSPSDAIKQGIDSATKGSQISTAPENNAEKFSDAVSNVVTSGGGAGALSEAAPALEALKSFSPQTGGELASLGAAGAGMAGAQQVSDSPLAALAGLFVPGLATGAISKVLGGASRAAFGSMTESQAKDAATKYVGKTLTKEGIDPATVAGRMQEAADSGIPITLPEASGSSTLLQNQKTIEKGTGQGANALQAFKQDRPGQIRDALGNYADEITANAESTAKPLYDQVGDVQIPRSKFKELLTDPVIADAVDEFNKNKMLFYKVQDKQPYSVGFLDEVKKYINAQAKKPTTDNYAASIYKDAARKITDTIDPLVPAYSEARAAAQPGIVAKNAISKPLNTTLDKSIGTLRNRIFGSPNQRTELKRGLGDENFGNLEKLMGYIDSALRGGTGGSDTAFNTAGAKQLSDNFGAHGVELATKPLNALGRFGEWYGDKVRQKDYKALSDIFTAKDFSQITKDLKGMSPSESSDHIARFLETKIPAIAEDSSSENGKSAIPQSAPAVSPPSSVVPFPAPQSPAPLQSTPIPLPKAASAPEQKQESPIESTINKAAQATGVDQNLLHAIAATESALNPQAQAKTSNAKGLFQITPVTWKTLVKRYGAAMGVKMSDIMDPEANAKMAAALTKENSQKLTKNLGRDITPGEAYIGHFMGAPGATKLLKADDGEIAASLFPKAAKSNRSIFYAGRTARSVGEVKSLLADKVESRMPKVQEASYTPSVDTSHIPSGAVTELKNNPALSSQFDAVFGEGAAESILNT